MGIRPKTEPGIPTDETYAALIGVENEEAVEKLVLTAIDELIEQARQKVIRDFPPEKFAYHNIEHTEMVMTAVEEAAGVFYDRFFSLYPDLFKNISKELFVQKCRLEAAHHDIVFTYNEEGRRKKGLAAQEMAKMRFGANEETAAAVAEGLASEESAAIQLINSVHSAEHAEEILKILFGDDPDAEMALDIGATVPDERFIPLEDVPDDIIGDRPYIQYPILVIREPLAEETESLSGVLLALSDVVYKYGRISSGQEHTVITYGNNVFKEAAFNKRAHKDITEAVETDSMDEFYQNVEKRRIVVKRILGWMHTQEGVMLGCEYNVRRIVEHNPLLQKHPDVGEMILDYYSDFQQAAEICRDYYDQAVSLLDVDYGLESAPEYSIIDEIQTLTEREKNLISQIKVRESNGDTTLQNLQTALHQATLLREKRIKQYEDAIDALSESDFKTLLEMMDYPVTEKKM